MNCKGDSVALAMYLYVTKSHDTWEILFFCSPDFKSKIYYQTFHAKITRNFFFQGTFQRLMERFLKINSRWSLLTSSIPNKITYFFQVTRQIYSLRCLDKFLFWKFSQLSGTIHVKENALWRHWRINVTCHSSCIHVIFLCSYCKRKKYRFLLEQLN